MTEMRVDFVSLKQLRPNPKNPNRHSPDQIARLAKIIEYQGFRQPIVVSKQTGFIVSGHGRYLAAKTLQLHSVPVIYQDFSDDQETAHIIADNAISSWSELDFNSINLSIPDLDPTFDIDNLGIKDFFLDPSEKPKKTCKHPQCPKKEID